jgi:hypothetical protein
MPVVRHPGREPELLIRNAVIGHQGKSRRRSALRRGKYENPFRFGVLYGGLHRLNEEVVATAPLLPTVYDN